MGSISKANPTVFPDDIERASVDELVIGESDTDNAESAFPNRHTKALSDRTLYLKEKLDELAARMDSNETLERVMPVGYIYMSIADARNPLEILGFGAWARVSGRVLVGINPSDARFDGLGDVGGAYEVGLTEANNGPHGHAASQAGHAHNVLGLQQPGPNNGGVVGYEGNNNDGSNQVRATDIRTPAVVVEVSGSGTPHNNIQPYIAVAMWRRVA